MALRSAALLCLAFAALSQAVDLRTIRANSMLRAREVANADPCGPQREVSSLLETWIGVVSGGDDAGSTGESGPGGPKLDPCGVPSSKALDAVVDGPSGESGPAATGGATGGTGGTGTTGATGATGAEAEENAKKAKEAKEKAEAKKKKEATPEAKVVEDKFVRPDCKRIRQVAAAVYKLFPDTDKSKWEKGKWMKVLCGVYSDIVLGNDVQGNADWKEDCRNEAAFTMLAPNPPHKSQYVDAEKKFLAKEAEGPLNPGTVNIGPRKTCAVPRTETIEKCAVQFSLEMDELFLGMNCRDSAAKSVGQKL